MSEEMTSDAVVNEVLEENAPSIIIATDGSIRGNSVGRFHLERREHCLPVVSREARQVQFVPIGM
jgi:hypothetical protein